MQQSRREFVAGLGGVALASALGRTTAAAQLAGMMAYVGSFSTPATKSTARKGLTVFRVDPVSNKWTFVQQMADLAMPNFLAFDRRQRYLYVPEGVDRDHVTALSVDQRTGELTVLNRQPTGGTGGMYAIVDPSNRFLIVPHVSGQIVVFPIKPDGSLAPMSDSAMASGKLGPHKPEQDTPTPHMVHFDRRGHFLLIPSRGYDAVYVFTLDTANGKLIANAPPSGTARSGAGPRHIGAHPTGPYAYVANELDSTVTTYRWDDQRGTLEPIQVIPSTPTTYTGNNTAAAIVVAGSGRFVYASNRGHDSVAIFSVEKSGVLAHVGWESTRGKTPRFIGFDPSERYLYVLNQGSDSILAFRVNQSNGTLSAPGGFVAEVAAPTCVVFATPGATASSL